MHKQLVAGLSRLVTCLQSNFIGTNFAGFCSNLGVRGLFSSPFVSYWVHIDWLAPGYLMGAGNPTISLETETQVPAACQPQPRQPHKKQAPHRHPSAGICKVLFGGWANLRPLEAVPGLVGGPHEVTRSQPINMSPVRNKGRAKKPADA